MKQYSKCLQDLQRLKILLLQLAPLLEQDPAKDTQVLDEIELLISEMRRCYPNSEALWASIANFIQELRQEEKPTNLTMILQEIETFLSVQRQIEEQQQERTDPDAEQP